jgi:hypothetical protein
MAEDRGMAGDREAALAAWRALPADSRRRAWAAAAEPVAIEDPELAAVVARYASAMRGRVPAGVVIVALGALFGWLALAGFWITHGRTGLGVVLAGAAVVVAGLGIGALQVRQANFDRLYACAVAAPGLRPRRRRGRRAGQLHGQPGRLPDGEQPEQHGRTDQHGDLDRGPVGPGSVRDARPHQRTGDQATDVGGDGDVGHGEGEHEVQGDHR